MLGRTSARLAWRLGRSVGAVRSYRTTAIAMQHQSHPKPVALSKMKDSFLDGTSSTYLEELEQRYRVDPSSVDRTWASFFQSMGGCPALVGGGVAEHSDMRAVFG